MEKFFRINIQAVRHNFDFRYWKLRPTLLDHRHHVIAIKTYLFSYLYLRFLAVINCIGKDFGYN